MLRFLFPRLTDNEPRGAALFARVVAEARAPSWFTELGVPDSLDGRFSVLATATALVIVRLERGGPEARQASVALTERFVESMDHEHRQLGYGDPTIGKIVRKLTGSLAKRVERFRSAVEQADGWDDATAASLKGLDESEQALRQGAAQAMVALWQRLDGATDEQLIDGEWK
jgi:cytochrome b pre-mRNA-processing protein 3